MRPLPAARAASYREMDVLSASPERLVVILFEQLVIQLERGRLGMERNDVELRVAGLAKARAILSELLATLDFERGGDIAPKLAELYQFMLVELVDIGRRGDQATMRKLVSIAAALRDGFAGAAASLAPARLSA
jgi:flagellar protein FliS